MGGQKVTITGNPNITATHRCLWCSNGIMQVSNGTYTSRELMAVDSSGTLTLSGGTYRNANSTFALIANGAGTTTISAGDYLCNNSNTLYNEGTLNVTGGTFSCKSTKSQAALINYGIANVTGGKFTSTTIGIANNSANANLTISGSANVETSSANPPLFVAFGTATVNNNAQMKANSAYGAYVAENGKLYIKGGRISSVTKTAVISGGTLNMSGGTATTANNNAWSLYKAGGTAVYTGGSIPQGKNF